MLAALVALPTSEERDTALHYLRERRPMIEYRAFAAAGLPIGSGCVESAHKTVLQARLKSSGMSWSLPTVTAMIAVRLPLVNGRWDETWPQVGPRGRVAQRERVARRRPARRPDPAPPPPVACPAPRHPAPTSRPAASGPRDRVRRPAATHPWRRPLIRSTPKPPTQM